MIAISSPKDLSGTLTIPGSKSHTIRACIFGALATGTSYIHNPLTSADCIAALTAIKEIGADYEMKDGLWIIHGAGTRLHLPENVIDVGNSGSVLYFLTPTKKKAARRIPKGQGQQKAIQPKIPDGAEIGCGQRKINRCAQCNSCEQI